MIQQMECILNRRDPNVSTISSWRACHLAESHSGYVSLSEQFEYLHQTEEIGPESYDIMQQELSRIWEVDQHCDDQTQVDGERKDERRKKGLEIIKKLGL